MERHYHIVDAFTVDRFAGNPAAVVLDTEGLTAQDMQTIAAEFNLSETTFVLPPTSPQADIRFRWFTPGMEVAMCGHASIAAMHAMVEGGRLPLGDEQQAIELSIETQSGILTAAVEKSPTTTGRMVYWLGLPTPLLSPANLSPSDVAGALGISADSLDESQPILRTQDDDVIVFVRNTRAVHGAHPDFTGLGLFQEKHQLRGVCLTTLHTLTPSVQTESRFFAPAAGINEDPVTGSVHGPLAAHLVGTGLVPMHDGVAGMQCVQTKGGSRSGLIWVLCSKDCGDGYAVKIGGHAVTVMKGTLV